MADPIEEEIQKEVKTHKILVYGKGTKQMPMCGFTRETMQFFDKYGSPFLNAQENESFIMDALRFYDAALNGGQVIANQEHLFGYEPEPYSSPASLIAKGEGK